MLELLITVYVVGMLKVLYVFGATISFLAGKKRREESSHTEHTTLSHGEGRGGYFPAQEYHFDMPRTKQKTLLKEEHDSLSDTLDYYGEVL